MSDDDLMTIAEFSEDISEAEAPEPLPVGEYPMSIEGADIRVSQRGTKYAAVRCVIKPEEYPADYPIENAPDGKVIIFRRLIMEDTPAARYQLRNFCEAIGATASKKVNVTDWIGLEGVAEIDHDEYEGVVREQIRRIKAA